MMESGSSSLMNGSMGEGMRRGMMGAEHMDQLSRLNGSMFDTRFVHMMSTHHPG